MNALGDPRVAEYLNENFVCTYLKVGTFRIINGQKVGGNVASYFCLSDTSVIHAIPGKTEANQLLNEARWAYEVRKAALTFGTNLNTGVVELKPYSDRVRKSHIERFHAESNGIWGANRMTIPANLPRGVSTQAQAHWLLARSPLSKLDDIYPIVWTQLLREQLSSLPVARR